MGKLQGVPKFVRRYTAFAGDFDKRHAASTRSMRLADWTLGGMLHLKRRLWETFILPNRLSLNARKPEAALTVVSFMAVESAMR